MQNQNKKKNIKYIINSPEFAEFYGLLIGDGCIYSNKSGLCISGDSLLDKNYHTNHVKSLINKIFHIKPKIYYSKGQRSIRTIIYSRKLSFSLNKMGFPLGKKKYQRLEIPKYFFNNNQLIRSCIKGIYDTDGTIYHHNGAKAIVEISITNNYLLKSIEKAFFQLNLPFKITTERIYFSGKKNALNFYKIIKPANKKHIIKYESLMNNKRIPSYKETERLLKQ